MWPSMLPDGRHFLFTAKHYAGLAESGTQGIHVGSLDDATDVRHLLPDLSSALYAHGHIMFARDQQLMAAPFDVTTRQVTGEPVSLGEPVAFDSYFFAAGISAAVDGTLAIRIPPAPAMSAVSGQSGVFEAEMALLDRKGSIVSRLSEAEPFTYHMAMSPDARSVVAQLQDVRSASSDLWRFDLSAGTRAPLTSMRTSGGYVGSPTMSPDGGRLAYGCQTLGMLDDVCMRDLGSGTVTKFVDTPKTFEHPVDWSADGQYARPSAARTRVRVGARPRSLPGLRRFSLEDVDAGPIGGLGFALGRVRVGFRSRKETHLQCVPGPASDLFGHVFAIPNHGDQRPPSEQFFGLSVGALWQRTGLRAHVGTPQKKHEGQCEQRATNDQAEAHLRRTGRR